MASEEMKDYMRSRLIEFLRANPSATEANINEYEGYYIIATPDAMKRITIADKHSEPIQYPTFS